MRPYLAIIKDSFRAAMASRVLYVLLLLITVLLVALAPLRLKETLDWELKPDVNVRNADRLVRRLVEKRDDPEEPAIGRIWNSLPSSTQSKLVGIVEKDEKDKEDSRVSRGSSDFVEQAHLYQELVDDLNAVIEDQDFYRPEDWENTRLRGEVRSLIDQGVESLSEIRVKRLNRLLIAGALGPMIDRGNESALDFYYAVWKFPFTANLTHQQFAQGITSQLPVYFDKFVMSIGLLIAIVVTANMIPDTFEPGSLNLLLSKPVFRWGLYLAKFLGGCVFILLCAGYLFVGVWLWMGLGLGVWDRAMLLSIPMYVIVFAIYFSVSALVGLVWRSPILAVIVTLCFWAFCFAIGSIYGSLHAKMRNSEIIDLLPVGEAIFSSNVLHELRQWNEATGKWEERVDAELGEQGEMAIAITAYFAPMRDTPDSVPGLNDFLAPVYDEDTDRVIASQFEFGQFLAVNQKAIFVSSADIEFQEAGKFPRSTLRMFETPEGLAAVDSGGQIFRLKQDVEFGSARPVAKSGELFEAVGPLEAVRIRSADHVGYSRQRDELAIYQDGTITLFAKDGDSYQRQSSIELEVGFDTKMTAKMSFGGDRIVVAFGNGQVILVDAAEKIQLDSFQLESRSGIRQVGVSGDGRYVAVLYRNGNLWWMDTERDDPFELAGVTGQGGVTAIKFEGSKRLWVADSFDRATVYAIESSGFAREKRHVPGGTWLEQSYRYLVHPLYRICPKPGEFYKVVTHLSSSGDTSQNQEVDLNKTAEPRDPWAPLWSGFGFMAVMLGLGCLVFQFRDY